MNTNDEIKLLIIDDDEVDAMVLQRYIHRSKTYNLACDYVSSLDEAMELLKANNYGLILLDNRLDMCTTAKEVLKAFQDSHITTPVIVTTGQVDEELGKEWINLGARQFTTKDNLDTSFIETLIETHVQQPAQT